MDPAWFAPITTPPLSVLVVTEAPNQPVEAILSQIGHRTRLVGAAHAAEALQLKIYDTLLLGADLAAAAQLELARSVRALAGSAGGVPIVAMASVWQSEPAREAASEAGIDALAPLPLQAGPLHTLLRLLARPRLVEPAELDEVGQQENDQEAADEQDARRKGTQHQPSSPARASIRAGAV